MGRKFELDRANGKLWGVCAGIANLTGWDVTLVRVGAVLVTLAGAFPWTLIAYAIAAFVAKPGRAERKLSLRRAAPAVRDEMREIDRRMAEVESFVTSSNGRLAQEIDSLR